MNNSCSLIQINKISIKHRNVKSITDIFDTIDDKGHYTKNIIKFSGTHIFKADEVIINELTNLSRLLGKGKLKHSYPHSWRSKAPLVHRATPQWFISMETNDLRKKSITAIGNTKFYPAVGQNRLRSMIETSREMKL